jgi:hypothetical protein
VQENEASEKKWKKERASHLELQELHHAMLLRFRGTEEEMERMNILYDAVESERNELLKDLERMSSELQLLRHVKAQKEKNVVLLLKEKERLHRDLSKEKKRITRRRVTSESLSQNKASASRVAQLEREKTSQLLIDMVNTAGSLDVGNSSSHHQVSAALAAKADVVLREKIAVLALQVKRERDRNTELEKEVAEEKRTSTALRVRLRNQKKTLKHSKVSEVLTEKKI